MSFNTALSGLSAASSDLRITGNNIANASTVGFKSSRAEFADVYASSLLGSGSNQIGSGVKLANVAQQFDQGTISFTNNSLDLAIDEVTTINSIIGIGGVTKAEDVVEYMLAGATAVGIGYAGSERRANIHVTAQRCTG